MAAAGHFGEAAWRAAQRPGDVEPRGRDADAFRLVEVFLHGGAPWGFTLRGGLEHREPLLITKVEEGSKAAAVGLQAADELVNINEIPLSGYRQEAICLVKGSHKTLSLVVKRRSEPITRPHSWHSTKFNENQSEPAKAQSPPTPAWHTRYDASSSSADLTSSWEQTNLRRVSDQFSSLGSMDSLEQAPHPDPAGTLAAAKSNSSMEHLGGGKRDSAYSSFSTSSGTPDYTLSKSNAASTESVLYKVNQWDTGGKHVGTRPAQSEGARPDDRVTYFQMPGCDGQHGDDQAGCRISTSSRSSFGPVWHVPEKAKKTSSPSPPPPAPPTRSDSFAATKQHERAHSVGHFEGQDHLGKTAADHRRSYNLSPKNDSDHGPSGGNKQHNVQQGHHGDKSTFYPQPWASSVVKPFGSAQEMQSNGSSHHNHRRNLSSSSSVASEQSNENSNRYYCVSTNPNVQPPFATEDRRISTSGERGVCLSPQTVTKMRYSLPPPQHATHAKAADERGIPPFSSETLYMNYTSSKTSEQRRSMPAQDLNQQANNKICPKATPILHSLSLDPGTNSDEPADGKNMLRNERFATKLRNEIQTRRARLQKSQSAATLPANETEMEDQDVWKSFENATPTSNAYKDHLKEMQARVLKATSFRRRDLEPVLIEHPTPEPSASYASAVRIEMNPSLPSVSESVQSKSGPVNFQVTRIGGRKRFPTERKVKSFSEPDKIHHVGMKEDGNLDSSLNRESGSTSCVRDADVGAQGKAVAPPPPRGPEETQGGSALPVAEHQRLGTFAEYEERWSTQKKAAVEKRASGRYRSADNILDHGTEERNQSSACYHERSRSSPSADVFVQTFPAPGRATESELPPAEERKAPEEPGVAAGSSDGPEQQQPITSEPHVAPPTCPGAACGRVSPAAGSHRPAAASSRDLQNAAEAGGDASRDSAPRPALAPPPEAEPEQQKQASPGADAMDTQRTPSPQFSPRQLSDKPPVSLHEDDKSSRSELVVEQHPAVKKVPIRIVHSEDAGDKENCPFLRQPDPAPAEGEERGVARLGGLGARGPDSVFCAFTRQKEPHRDSYISTAREHGMSAGEPANHAEEQKRAELVQDIMGKDKALAEILDQSRMKTTMDLMEGIFPEGEPHQRRKQAPPRTQAPPRAQATPRSQDDRESEESAAGVTMVTSAAYFSTSAPKAELLIKMKDMPEEEAESEEELDLDLASKKQELIDSLSKKLQVLREARQTLQDDILDNNCLGDEVEAQVQQLCKPNQLDKFRMFVGDLDKVVSLLLSLSGRLARVENALNSLEEDATPEERRTLTEKRKLLIRQHEDAKELKENLDRRERVVYDILANYLQDDALTDYEHFVKMKSALIIEQRKLEDKIKLGEEQLKCLLDSLPLEQRLCL